MMGGGSCSASVVCGERRWLPLPLGHPPSPFGLWGTGARGYSGVVHFCSVNGVGRQHRCSGIFELALGGQLFWKGVEFVVWIVVLWKEDGMRAMSVTDKVHVVAGTFIMVSLALGRWIHPGWYIFTDFVGLNLFQYGLTGFCPMALILKRCERSE